MTPSQRAAIVAAVYDEIVSACPDNGGEPMPDLLAIPTADEIDALADWMGAHDALHEHLDTEHAEPGSKACPACAPLISEERRQSDRLDRIEREAVAWIGRAR